MKNRYIERKKEEPGKIEEKQTQKLNQGKKEKTKENDSNVRLPLPRVSVPPVHTPHRLGSYSHYPYSLALCSLGLVGATAC